MSGEPNVKPSPFHEGEVALQRTVGVAERMEQFGRRVIRDHMPDQHRQFYRQLPFIVLGAVDHDGDAWATLVAGRPGFMSSPDPRHLRFNTTVDPSDPAGNGLGEGAAVGLLGIELHTRRRNRMNGRILQREDGGFTVEVEHAFGNCPQYIQLRDFEFSRAPGELAPSPVSGATDLSDSRVREIIESADTFFVSSYMEDAGTRQVDASHRGGKPGFVRINADGSLTIPDFAGNLHFNTLGNFLRNPRAGLAFPDFATGDILQLTGDAEVVLDSPEIAAFQGAERLWVFRPRKAFLRQAALPLRFTLQADGWSPNSLMTGGWDQVADRLEAEALKAKWRPFRVRRIVEESRVIRSIHLEPADGKGILAHEAGQHLPIRVVTGDASAPVIRTYTISTAPSDGHYRISVKRQGVVSSFLHHLKPGDIVEARAPAGNFTIDAQAQRPAVLLAAGVGVTPILAMLRKIVFEGLRKRRVRPTHVFIAARTLAERAFDAEIAELKAQAGNAVSVVRVLDDLTGAIRNDHYDAEGRVDLHLLRNTLPLDGYDFYMCGPPPFMQGLYDQLRSIGTPDERIHAEAFGPASIKRTRDRSSAKSAAPVSTQPVPVAFSVSGREARWEPGSGSLLELAEARGLTPDYSCRGGTCGTCAVRVLSGAVAYPEPPQARIPEGSALICCAMPADRPAGGDRLLLEL